MYTTTKEQLTSTIIPAETRTYKPVQHQQLIDLTLESILSAGFELGEETYTMASDGKIANGRYTIKSIADSEMELQIGWQNSYDKSLSLKFAIGTQIIVCSNGCVAGDFGNFKKRHVGDVQMFTPAAITDYIKSSGEIFTQIQKDREAMKEIKLTKRTTAELIGRMIIEDSIIKSTQLNIIKEQLEKPAHDYGATNSLWELYQHTTYAMKELHPFNWMPSHMNAHKFFNGVANQSNIITLS